MNKIFPILCFVLCPAIANATNFEVCVNEANTNQHAMPAEGYTSFKCEGTTAEKLLARPDECPGGTKPSLRSLIRKSKQFDDGFWSSVSWTAGKCVGSCETRSYDSKDTTYLCEVRVYGDDSRPAAESNRERPAPGGPGSLRPRPGSPGPGGPDAGGPGPGGRQADARLRRRPPPPGPVWSPRPPRRYSQYRYSDYSRYGPGFSGRPGFEPPPDPYYEEYRQPPNYEGYRRQPRCDCN
jgi:hypothetical protein